MRGETAYLPSVFPTFQHSLILFLLPLKFFLTAKWHTRLHWLISLPPSTYICIYIYTAAFDELDYPSHALSQSLTHSLTHLPCVNIYIYTAMCERLAYLPLTTTCMNSTPPSLYILTVTCDWLIRTSLNALNLLTDSLPLSLPPSLTHSHSHSPTPSLSYSLPHLLTHSHPPSLSHLLTPSLTPSLSLSLSLSLTLLSDSLTCALPPELW